MKRDMDLVRDIALVLEDENSSRSPEQLRIEGVGREVVTYHLRLMMDAHLIEAEDISAIGPGNQLIWAKRLTWMGHEFLDAARDESVWKSTLSTLGGRFASVPFTVLQQVLTKTITGELKLES